MHRILEIKIVGNHQIQLKFEDGLIRIIDFRPFIKNGLSKDLSDIGFFNQVEIESGGGLSWPNGFDFCPNFLHDYIREEIQHKEVMNEAL